MVEHYILHTILGESLLGQLFKIFPPLMHQEEGVWISSFCMNHSFRCLELLPWVWFMVIKRWQEENFLHWSQLVKLQQGQYL
mmetsp:Transcript_2368/g.5593  ORF Transcript_2368/g.5593 Transcript_2368/m.5593 type:complete len:82 (-) Transcript_2368:18-263(-)